MNNSQFRKLLADQNGEQPKDAQTKPAQPAAGTKKASLVPMTPRNVRGGSGVDFARQVRERNAALQPTKKFKSSAPKGVKYGEGYTDRAKARSEADAAEEVSKAARIQALEEQMKLGQISQETFEALRDEITGGDVSSTHLVKGLDRKLLERVRRGEDVLGTGDGGGEFVGPAPNVDDELDKLGEKEVQAVEKGKAEKRGTMAPPNVRVGMKRSRDEIMAELKAQRQTAKEAKAAQEKAVLGEKWRKVGEQKSKVEIDSKGREVLITVDEDGNVKKKIRKMAAQPEETKGQILDPSKPILGADATIPVQAPQPAEDEGSDDDIFEGAGTEYDPLGGADDSDEESDDEGEHSVKQPNAEQAAPQSPDASSEAASEPGEASPPQLLKPQPAYAPAKKRDYFGNDTKDEEDRSADRFAGIKNVLQKAAKLDAPAEDDLGSDEEAQAKRKKRARMLAQQDRDMEDMDMGFGGSRFDDAEDAEAGDTKVRLSEWKGEVGHDEDDSKGEGKKKRERKPKKRKGDASNMNDIMRVIEGRKAGGK